MLMTLEVSNLLKSNEVKERQLSNIAVISYTFLVSISLNCISLSEKQSWKIPSNFLTFFTFLNNLISSNFIQKLNI